MSGNFKKFNEDRTESGPGRIAVSDTVVTSDPANMAAIISNSAATTSYVFVSPFEDLGATEGGITMTKGHTEQAYRVDQSEGDFKSEITGHTATITTNLAELSDVEKFVLSWMAPDATTVTLVTFERTKGIGARRTVPHRSLVVVTLDDRDKLRAYFWRDVANNAGDSAINIAPGALHAAPLNLKAYPKSSATDKEFGYIKEENLYGNIDSST